MATTPARVTVAGMARQYLANVGATFPVDARVAIDTTVWTEVGLFTSDSLKFSTDPSFEDIEAHQSPYPVRTIQTGDAATLEVDLLEWSSANFSYVYGGGAVTPIALTGPIATHYKFTPPAIGGRAEKASLTEITDGTKVYRLCIPRVFQQEGAELSFDRSSASILPLRLKVLGDGSTDAWYLLTSDTAFVATAPDLVSLAPTTGPTAGGTSVLLAGTGFASGMTVTVGGTAATGVNVLSSTTAVIVTPANTAGAKAIVVTTTGGTDTLANAFTYS